LRSPGFIPPGNGGRIFFLPSAVVVGENADARGTEAVKLSVKLLSGLTLIALVAVAVVGLSHSASAAVDAKVYVTNKASGLTTEPSTAVVGRTSATTVYGTYKSNISTGTTARDIVADSDTFIVTVIDADLNVTTTISSNSASGGYNVANTLVPTDATQVAGSGFNSAGDKIQLTIADKAGDPIIGSVSDIKLYATGTATAVAGATVTSIDYVGDGVSNPALITIQCNFAPCASGNIDVTYPSSSRDTTTASVKSVVYTGAASVIVLTETGRNTGRFEGEMEVFERIDTPAGKVGTATTIPAIGGPITVSYVDAVTSGSATKVARTATYSLDTTVPEASITSPTTASESQSRLPSFTGTVTDNGSGLDVSTFALHIDDTDDAKDTDNVISVGVSTNASNVSQPPTFFGKIASIDMSA